MQFTEKDLIKYMKNTSTWVILLVAGVIAAVWGTIDLSNDPEDKQLIYGILLLILGIGAIGATLYNIIVFNMNLRKIRKDGTLEQYLADFNKGEFMLRKNIRLCEQYIFGQGKGFPTSYAAITRVYQQVNKKNGSENSRQLMAIVRGGGTVALCDLRTGGQDDEELKRVLLVILSKNPNILIGYK